GKEPDQRGAEPDEAGEKIRRKGSQRRREPLEGRHALPDQTERRRPRGERVAHVVVSIGELRGRTGGLLDDDGSYGEADADKDHDEDAVDEEDGGALRDAPADEGPVPRMQRGSEDDAEEEEDDDVDEE